MFTGIITHVGQIISINQFVDKDLALQVSLANNSLSNRSFDIGCSISCNGICLTLIKRESTSAEIHLFFQASKETQDRTTINNWQEGDELNLEFSLRAGDELGGHMVQGHVDCVSKILNIKQVKESWVFEIEIPNKIKKHISKKGSITINGTSLTVNNVYDNFFDINIIPHTFKNTNFNKLKKGDFVNIEIDMIARYLEKLISK